MRISVSMIFAFIISFMLLGMMANLVRQDMLMPIASKPVWAPTEIVPTQTTKHEVIRKRLEDAPKTQRAPSGPVITIEPTDNGDPTISLPPLNPGGVDELWPTPETFTPGTERRADENGNAGNHLVPISQLQPLYPREAAARGIEGWVSLRFEVRQDGTVGNVSVLDASPRNVFDQVARQAVQRWRYQPTEQGPVVQTVTLQFTLEN